MKYYYVSLVRQLYGYCFVVYAPSENAVRLWCSKYLGRLWCSVYEENEYEMRQLGKITHINEEGEE